MQTVNTFDNQQIPKNDKNSIFLDYVQLFIECSAVFVSMCEWCFNCNVKSIPYESFSEEIEEPLSLNLGWSVDDGSGVEVATSQ